MSEITRVALDAMGGDNAPREMVKGAVEAVRKRKDIKVLLTGKEDVIRKELSAYTYPEEQIEIVNATEVIETAEPPVKAIRGKKDSSIVVAMKMVKKGEADAFVSAGSSGAVLVGGQVLVDHPLPELDTERNRAGGVFGYGPALRRPRRGADHCAAPHGRQCAHRGMRCLWHYRRDAGRSSAAVGKAEFCRAELRMGHQLHYR